MSSLGRCQTKTGTNYIWELFPYTGWEVLWFPNPCVKYMVNWEWMNKTMWKNQDIILIVGLQTKEKNNLYSLRITSKISKLLQIYLEVRISTSSFELWYNIKFERCSQSCIVFWELLCALEDLKVVHHHHSQCHPKQPLIIFCQHAISKAICRGTSFSG